MDSKIEEYILKEISRGFSEKEIRNALKKRGHSGKVIDKYFIKVKKEEGKEKKEKQFFDWKELPLLLLGCLFFILLFTTKFNFLVWFALVPFLIVTYDKPIKKIIIYSIITGVISSAGIFFWVAIYKYSLFFLAIFLFSAFFILFGASLNFIYSKDKRFYFIAPAVVWTFFIFIFSMTRFGGYWIELSIFHTSNYLLTIIGSTGVTFLIILINSLIAFTVIKRKISFSISLLLVSIVVFSGWFYYQNYTPTGGEKIRVALIQTNIQMSWGERQQKMSEIYSLYEQLTIQASEKKPDIVVWPEYAVNVALLGSEYFNKSQELAKKTNAMLIIGSMSFNFGEVKKHYDTAYVFSSNGDYLGYYESVTPAFFNLYTLPSKSKSLPVFEIKNKKFGLVMCYEETVGWIPRKYSQKGANFLISLTDNQDIFANGISLTSLYSRLRAAENNIYFAREGSVGITQFIYPNGQMKSSLKPFERGILVEEIKVDNERTFYSKFDNLIIWLIILIYAAYLFFTTPKKQKSKGKAAMLFLLSLSLFLVSSSSVDASGKGGGCNDACCAGFPSKALGTFCASENGKIQTDRIYTLHWECSGQAVSSNDEIRAPSECQFCQPKTPSPLCYIPVEFIKNFGAAKEQYQSGWSGSTCKELYEQLCDPVKNKIDPVKCKTDSTYKCACSIDFNKEPLKTTCTDFNQAVACPGIYYANGQADFANYGSEKDCTATCPAGTLQGTGLIPAYVDSANPNKKYARGTAKGYCSVETGSCDYSFASCLEADCSNGLDDDTDGLSDGKDTDCQRQDSCEKASYLSYNAKGIKIKCCGINLEKDSGFLTETGDFVCAKSPECSTKEQFCWLDAVQKRGNVYSIAGSTRLDEATEKSLWDSCTAQTKLAGGGFYESTICWLDKIKSINPSRGNSYYEKTGFTLEDSNALQTACLAKVGNNEIPLLYCWLDEAMSKSYIILVEGTSKSYDVLAENNIWYACDALGDGTGNFEKILPDIVKTSGQIVTSNNHDFLCKQGSEVFAECCGSTECLNQGTGGTKHFTGEKITVGTTTYYCTADGQWASNLDDRRFKQECEQSGFFFTGTQCCGDGAPTNKAIKAEYYNDPLVANPDYFENGGCFASVKIQNSTRVFDVNVIIKSTFDLPEFIDGRDQAWVSFNKGRNKVYVENSRLIISGDSSSEPRGVYQDISGRVRPGGTYRLEADINPRGLSSGRIQFDFYQQYPTSVLDVQAGSVSKKYSSQFQIPSSTSGLKLRILVTAGATGSVTIDDINLTLLDKSIIAVDGEFYGCAQQDSNSDGYADIYQSTNTFQYNLIKNAAYCTPKGEYYCSFTKSWEQGKITNENNEIEIINESKSLPGQTAVSACCPQMRCWDGKTCTANQADSYTSEPITYNNQGYRCIEGKWKPAVKKFNWDYTKFGYCPDSSQCIVDAEKKYCANNTKYVADHLCEDGKWTSRTKFVALQMLSMAEGDYTLYCDEYTNSLAFYDYQVPLFGGAFIQEFVEGRLNCVDERNNAVPCANNFCILRDSRKTIFGTSLNQHLNAKELPFTQALGNIICEGAYNFNDGKFHRCIADQKTIWYNNRTGLIIYSNQSIANEPADYDYTLLFETYLKSPTTVMINTILDVIKPRQKSGPYFFYDFIKNTNDFNKIYLAKKGSREIVGIMERKGTEKEGSATYLAVNYKGFDVDICRSANVYDSKVTFFDKKGEGLFYCQNINGRYYIVTRDDGRGSPGGLVAWQELTSKLRLT